MKLTQRQIDKYLKKVIGKKIRLPKYNPELKRKILVLFKNVDDANEMDKNLCSKEAMRSSMALVSKYFG